MMQRAPMTIASSSPRLAGAQRQSRDQAGIHDASMRAVGHVGMRRPTTRGNSSWVPAFVPKARFLRDAGMTLGLMLCTPIPPALAQPYQPSVACRASDSNMALDLYLPLAKDNSGNAARGMRGELQIHHQKMPAPRRRWNLDDKLPAQFWNVGNDLKIRLLPGTGEELVDLVIEVQKRSQSAENGTFRLETAEGVKVQGRINCQID